MKGTLCCIFNYAPLYREAAFTAIDRAFDAQFCLADEVTFGRGDDGIPRMDTSKFRRPVIKIRNRLVFNRHPWRTGLLRLALKRQYTTYLVTGDQNWAYIPFLILCRLLKKPVYGWGHGVKNLNHNKFYRRWFHSRLAGYFIYGDLGRDRMAALGFDTSKIHVIHNSLVDSLDPDAFTPPSNDFFRERFQNPDPVLVFSGRLTPAKRADLLIDALLRINSSATHSGSPDTHPDTNSGASKTPGRVLRCNLIVIGDGPERPGLEAMAAPLAGRVWFYGPCYDPAKTAELLGAADLCVSPGNVGLMAVHAMQCGTPVISHSNFETQMPEYETIVEDYNGALFRENDPAALASAIGTWLERHSSDRDRIRRNCLETVAAAWTASFQIQVLLSVLKP